MSTWQISESGTEVALDDQGRGEVTFLVTNTGDTQDRSVLTITALDGAGDSWFAVEEPQRLVLPKDSAAYLCKVVVPAGTAAGTYALQAVAYSADRDPGETSTTSRRVTLTVKESAPPPPPKPWWAIALAVVILVVVVVVVMQILPDDGLANDDEPAITGTPVVLQVLDATTGSWSKADEELGFAFQWERCDAEGDECEAIEGATLPAYQVGGDDLDRTLRVAVTASVEEETATATSQPIGPVTAPPPPEIPVPPVVGLPLNQAINTLAANFPVVTLTAGDPANNCNPPVESQAPAAGTLLLAGEQVTISSRPRGGPLIRCLPDIFDQPVLSEDVLVFQFEELEDLGGGG